MCARKFKLNCCRDAGVVVVGSFDHTLILLQIDADQQAAASTRNIGNAPQKFQRFIRLEIADSRSGKINNITRRACDAVKATRQVASNRRIQAGFPGWEKFFGKARPICAIASQRCRPGYKRPASRALQ